MNESKRLGEHVIGALFRWRAAILNRVSGPGGLYNLGDALGFGSGLLIAYLGWWESRAPSTTFFQSECDMWREVRPPSR